MKLKLTKRQAKILHKIVDENHAENLKGLANITEQTECYISDVDNLLWYIYDELGKKLRNE